MRYARKGIEGSNPSSSAKFRTALAAARNFLAGVRTEQYPDQEGFGNRRCPTGGRGTANGSARLGAIQHKPKRKSGPGHKNKLSRTGEFIFLPTAPFPLRQLFPAPNLS